MARNATLAEMVAIARQLSDLESVTDRHPTSTFENWINQGIAKWQDLLMSHRPEMLEITSNITTVVGQFSYPLPSDFYRLIAFEVPDGNQRYRPLKPFQEGNRRQFEAPQSGLVVRVRYVPVSTKLTNATPGTTDVLDTVNAWGDDFASVFAARRALIKDAEWDGVATLGAELKDLTMRIESLAAERDVGEAPRVTDVYAGVGWPCDPYIIDSYRLSKNTVELVKTITWRGGYEEGDF